MERSAAEGVDARYVRQFRPIELTDRENYHVAGGRLGLSSTTQGQGPRLRLLIPRSILNFRPEHDVLVKSVLLRHSLQVGQNVATHSKIVRPYVGRECIAIDEAIDVDTTPRIAILQPRASNVGVLLIDGEGNTRLLQSDTKDDPTLSRTHDSYVQRPSRGDPILAPQRPT